MQQASSTRLAVRRWWTIMPIVFITYSLAYLDRANFGFASAAGINHDLGISKGLASLIGALFFLGYFFFQIPGAIYAERRSVKKLVFVSLILWGGCAALTGVVTNIPSLMVMRFMLGIVEAAVMPAMLIFIANWFTKSRALTRQHVPDSRQSGDGAVDVGGVRLSGRFVRLAPHVHRRRRAGGHLGGDLVVHRAGQAGAGEMALRRRKRATWKIRCARNRPPSSRCKNYGEAFKSPAVIKLCAQYFCWSIGVYGFVLWLPSILKNAFVVRHGRDRLAVGRAVSGRNHRDARGVVGIGQTASAARCSCGRSC